MGSSSSNQISESNKDKSSVKRNPMNKPKSYYCFTDEEVEIIQSLLTEKKYELNDYISYMAYVDIDEKNITCKEYATVLTPKKDGQAYSGGITIYSKILKGKVLTTNVKINNIPIETIRRNENIAEDKDSEIEIDYNLNENDSSIMTIEINTNSKTKRIYTDNYSHFLCLNFRSPSGFPYFKLNAKCSPMFGYSNISRKPKNKFEKISPTEILIAGKEDEDNNTITFRRQITDYHLNGDVENIYNCDTMELFSLNYALNSVGLNYDNTNIFGIKDIFDVGNNGVCNAKSFIYLYYPTDSNENLFKEIYFDLEQNSLKVIDTKVNNTQVEFIATSYGEVNIKYNFVGKQFCTVELDYSFKLREIVDKNEQYYNLCVKHISLLDKGFYSCEINLRFYEYQILSNGLYCDDFDKDRETTKLKYKGFKIENPLIMLKLW